MVGAALELGFSPCPNDTFMFHGLVRGRVRVPGLRFLPVMEDIAALNQRALGPAASRLPISKLSAHVLGLVTDRYSVLDSGAALGRGCGPLVVRRAEREQLDGLAALAGCRVAIPGRTTTAHLLLRIFGPRAGTYELEELRFDEIMPAVAAGRCDAGVIIHESRFTYRDHGLVPIADLGERWERDTGLPLPLGVIAIERGRGRELAEAVERGLRRSIEAAWVEPSASAAFIREHAQEMDADVCRRHIALYVNASSATLGVEGRAAIEALLRRGQEVGLLPAGARSPWR